MSANFCRRTVKDRQTGQNVVLSEKDAELIDRIQSGKIPDAEFTDFQVNICSFTQAQARVLLASKPDQFFTLKFQPWIEWFSSQVMDTPVRAIPPSKASFLPSKIDKMKISKMVHAIKMGWMKPQPPKPVNQEKKFYMLWDAKSDTKAETMRRIHDHIPAPKPRLPGTAESYNPPAEYLFDKDEVISAKYVPGFHFERQLLVYHCHFLISLRFR